MKIVDKPTAKSCVRNDNIRERLEEENITEMYKKTRD